MANESSRREILVASAALAGGASAALIASCGGGNSNAKNTETVSTIQMQDDAAILNTLLDLEASAVVAYGLIAARLRGRAATLALQVREQERRHASTLGSIVPRLGQPAARPKPAHEYQSTFPPLPDAHAALAFALDVEQTAIGAYADAIAKVVTDDVRATLGAILATESEHAAVVLGELGRPQVPDAFVTGPPPQGSG